MIKLDFSKQIKAALESEEGFEEMMSEEAWAAEKNKGKEPPEFMSTHPSSDNRIKNLNEKMNEVILDFPPINLT